MVGLRSLLLFPTNVEHEIESSYRG
jgi:hypothetical protein